MKNWFLTILLALFTLTTLASPALAADQWHKFSAKDAIAGDLGKKTLNPKIRLYMKGEQHGKVVKQLGEYKANKRSNGFGHSAQSACDRAFISALVSLQERAEREGGNAVIDIYTITKDEKFESPDQYSCIKGAFVTNVALMGTVAKLAQ